MEIKQVKQKPMTTHNNNLANKQYYKSYSKENKIQNGKQSKVKQI